MAPVILWSGLGNMGRGMSKNIAEKAQLDSPLLLHNRSSKRAYDLSKTLESGKTEVIESIAIGVQRADIIFTCVANDDAVQGLYTTILKEDVKGKLLVDCSTIHPDTTEAIAKQVTDKGAEFVAAPVFGAPPAADAGQLIPVLAGPKESVDRVRPYWKGVMAKAEIDMSGRSYGKAAELKILGNSFILNMVEQIAEAHVVAEKSKLGTDVVQQFIDSVFGAPYTAYSQRMLTGDYHTREEPLFAASLARKDARHGKKLASDAGARLLNLETADAHLEKIEGRSEKAEDITGIYGALREEAGLKFENDV